MIKVYGAGSKFGLPDPSPFVSKAQILLKMAGLAYETAPANFPKAPKGKIPYFDIDGQHFGDSTFLRFYLEDKHGIDFDAGLSDAERATAWAVEKMAEEHLYWAVVQARWHDEENFNKGPRTFFDDVPALLRPIIIAKVRKDVKRNMWGHGIGRHTDAEIVTLAKRDIKTIADTLGDTPWLMGETPCGADAYIWSITAGILCDFFECEVRTEAETYPNLKAYVQRGFDRWYPDLKRDAA